MPTTYDEAYDTITSRLIDEWPSVTAPIVGTAPELRFTGMEVGELPQTYFARFTMIPVMERQRTFTNAAGNQRYKSEGIIFVQVFSPRSDELAAEYQRKLCQAARNIFRGKTFAGCIAFYNVRINNLDPETKFLRSNVVAEYEFDEIG